MRSCGLDLTSLG